MISAISTCYFKRTEEHAEIKVTPLQRKAQKTFGTKLDFSGVQHMLSLWHYASESDILLPAKHIVT
jgi:hypothetical protein